MLKVPGSNPTGSIKIACFYRNFLFFYFFQKSNFWHKKLPPLKPILALPTWGQICLVSEIHPFEIKNFDLGHPVYAQCENFLSFRFFVKSILGNVEDPKQPFSEL